MRQNTRALVETGFLTTIIIMLVLLGVTIPFLGFLGTVIAPATLAVIGVRWGSRYSLASSTVALLLLSIFLGPLAAVTAIVSFSLMGVCIGEAYREGWSAWKHMAISTVAFLAGMALVFYAHTYILMLSPVEIVQKIHDGFQSSVAMWQNTLDPAGTDNALAQFETQWSIITRSIVGLFIGSGAMFVFMISRVCEMLFRRLNITVKPLPELAMWRTGIWAPYLFGLGLFVAYLGPAYGYDWIGSIGMNVELVGFYFCIIHGIGALWSLYNAKAVRTLWRVVLTVFLLVTMPLSVAIFGIIDMFYDLRHRYVK